MSVEQTELDNDTWQFSAIDSQPSEVVVEAMAFVTNRDPLDIKPLANAIDPDALDEVLSSDQVEAVSFRWEGHDVEISAAGEISIL